MPRTCACRRKSDKDTHMPIPPAAPRPQYAPTRTHQGFLITSNYRFILGAIMAASLAVLVLTSKAPTSDTGVLAFTDATDTTGRAFLALCISLWLVGCTATRRSLQMHRA